MDRQFGDEIMHGPYFTAIQDAYCLFLACCNMRLPAETRAKAAISCDFLVERLLGGA